MRWVWLLLLCATQAHSTAYFLATAAGGGNDANNGLSSGTPWLSPNHALNCGDTITAAASTAYAQANFTFAKWGTVTCSGHGVAWLKCVTAFACKLTSTSNGMWITASHWGVMGWEVTATTGQSICFEAFPPSTSNLTDIIFANDIANGCYGAGFQPVANGSAGVDYFVVLASLAYNAAQQSTECGSGITITAPAVVDTQVGTHIYISQTFTWNNLNPAVCSGGAPTDGEGVIFDSWDVLSYTQQGVIENNIAFLNGSSGFRVVNSTLAHIYVLNNTSYGNNGDHNMNSTECGEITNQDSILVEEYKNIAVTNASTGCGANPNYAYFLTMANGSTDKVYLNMGYSAAGNNNICSGTCSGFSFGPANLFGTNPNFVSPVLTNPGAPNCAGQASVITCMASTIAGFTATNTSAAGWGYQPVNTSASQPYDPLFPQWLCDAGLPSGLVTMACGTPALYKD